MMLYICVIKRLESRSLDRDRAVEMRSSPFHQSRYNSFNLATCMIEMRWTAGTLDRRASIVIQRLIVSHVTCIKNNSVELSPTRRKLKEGIGYIMRDGLED